MTTALTAERLRECLDYDPKTGVFTWLVSTGRRVKIGDAAGYIDQHGYVVIRIDGKNYKAHRLAWFYIYGNWPKNQIDHIDGVKCNNRINNLRDVDCVTNNQNQRKAQTDNKCGLLGVRIMKNRFQAQIRINGKKIHLGLFNDPEAAHAAYIAAKRIYHEGCTI